MCQASLIRADVPGAVPQRCAQRYWVVFGTDGSVFFTPNGEQFR